jgi:uncharacterized protein
MIRIMRWLAILLFAGLAQAQTPPGAEPLSNFPEHTLTIATADAKLHRFKVWIADTEPRQAQGLMFVKQLDTDRGMLFIYRAPRQITMWMKNTFIPLDMIFIRSDGRIAHIAENTTPHSLKTIASNEPAIAVLEVPAGTAKRLHIRAGSIAQDFVVPAN